MTTAVFIGTFDPLHAGHVGQLLRTHQVIPLSKVLVLIDKNPAHKPHASSWQHRLEMAKLTLGCFDLPFAYEVLAAEDSLAGEIIQKIDYKITGIDSFIENITDPSRWKFIQKWPMIVLSLPGIEESEIAHSLQSAPKKLKNHLEYKYISEVDAPLMNYDFDTQTFSTKRVHATHLRSGGSKKFIPPSVQEYIQAHQLYSA